MMPQDRRLFWAVTVLALLALTSTCLSALCLYHVLALQAEVEVLRTEVSRRREEQRDTPGAQSHSQQEDRRDTQTLPHTGGEGEELGRQEAGLKKRSLGSESHQSVFQPCLQMMADSRKEIFQKEFALETHTGVPWQTGLKRGEALEEKQNTVLVKEEGYYYIYSQVEHCDPPVTEVYYKDPTYAMGHIVIRMKKNVVGNESQHVVLFRCIQSMNVKVPYNTCYTGGIVKLEVGDRLELLIPRSTANISLDGDSTYLGVIKLA